MRSAISFLTALLLGLALLAPLHAQDLAKRLILKDGSYQLATKWEVNGDRVRYYSAEREDWEEVPNSLVDWDATEKFQKERTVAPAPEAVDIDKEVRAEKLNQGAMSPQVAPGLRLPPDSSVMLFDTFNGQPQLNELDQQGGEVDKDEKANLLRSVIPVGSNKQTIEIEGVHARVQSHVTAPAIYVNLEQNSDADTPQQAQQPEQPWDRFHIVRLQVKKGKRIIGSIKMNPMGKVSQEQNLVTATSQQLTGGWIKVTPTAALAAGEYAVVEIRSQGSMNAYVWDFGVDPSAPANPGALRPEGSPPQPPPPLPNDLKPQR